MGKWIDTICVTRSRLQAMESRAIEKKLQRGEAGLG